MNYLEPTVLTVFIYFLFNNKKFDLSVLPENWKKKLIQRIYYDYGLDDIFFFTVNKNNLFNGHNYLCLKYVYDNCASMDNSKDQTVISVQNMVKAIIEDAKIEDNKEIEIKVSDLINISNSPVRNCTYIYKVIDIGIIESKRKRFEDFIYNDYLEEYKKGKLKPRDFIVPDDLKTTIIKSNEILKPYFKLPQPVKIRVSKSYLSFEKELRFYELMLYLKKEEIIEINSWSFKREKSKDIYSGLENGLNIKLTFKKDISLFKKEISPMDIASKEREIRERDQNKDIVLKLDYDDFSGEISIKELHIGIVKKKKVLIKRLHSKINKIVFEYLFFKCHDVEITTEILKKEFKNQSGQELIKTLKQIAQELNFKGNIKKLFFKTRKNYVILRTEITKEQLDKSGIETSAIMS